MKQKLSFGLVLGRFAILKRFNCVIWEMFPFSSFIKADNLLCIRYHLRFFKAWVNWMENSTIFFCRSTSDYKYGLEDCKILISKSYFCVKNWSNLFDFFMKNVRLEVQFLLIFFLNVKFIIGHQSSKDFLN